VTRAPLERLAAGLKTSTPHTLAIETDASALLADARHRHATAVAHRQTLEQSRWAPFT